MGISVGDDGSVYVADTGNRRIQKFDGWGRLLGTFGGRRLQRDLFKGPSDVAVGRDGVLFVSDRMDHRIQRLKPSEDALGDGSQSLRAHRPPEFSDGLLVR